MAMVCPKCSGAFDQRLECPRCEVRLHFQELPSLSGRHGTPSTWQQSGWGRILIGLVLAQGVYHGIRHLTVAILLALETIDPQEFWTSLSGVLVLQSYQLLGLFLGGLLAGAGQRLGIVLGLLLGLWNGVLLVLLQPDMVDQFDKLTLYGLPLLQAVLGALAGWLGSRIWRPLAPLSPGVARQPAKKAPAEKVKLFVGPISWVRVVFGTVAAVAGSLSADVLLDRVKRLSDYALSPSSVLQAQVMTWEIVAVSLLLGGALAGVSTRNGLTQGLAVGISTSLVLLGIRMSAPDAPEFLLLVAAMFGPIILATLGGGFGAQLLPPLIKRPRRAFDTL